MARSVSRSRKGASKSPARVKRRATPKSEPKKLTSPKSEPKKKTTPKGHSRSRSASRGRKVKKSHKPEMKDVSRSRSKGRGPAGASMPQPGMSPAKTSPKRHPEVKKALSSSSVKLRATKTPPVKTPVSKPPMKSLLVMNVPTAFERESRQPERILFTSTPVEPEFRQRYLRNESSSRSPAQVRIKRPADSICSSLYNQVCGTVSAAGRCVCANTRAVCNEIVANRCEIFVTFSLLLLVGFIAYFVLHTEPAKTRAFIHSIPGKIHAWYQKHIARK